MSYTQTPVVFGVEVSRQRTPTGLNGWACDNGDNGDLCSFCSSHVLLWHCVKEGKPYGGGTRGKGVGIIGAGARAAAGIQMPVSGLRNM